MKRVISVIISICLILMAVIPLDVLIYSSAIDLNDAEPIDEDTSYSVTVEGSGDYLLASFTASEDGYYLFEAIGTKSYVFPSSYTYTEPVATLYDSDGNELQYVEFDFYYPGVYGEMPYLKMVQKMSEGETYYFKTGLLNPDDSGTYTIRVKKSPDFVFTYESGTYYLYRYVGASAELTINSNYTVTEENSLFVPPDGSVPLETIGLNSCEGNEYLEDLTISTGIYYIASEAFLNCKNLSSVTLGSRIKTIGYRAFAGCDSLKSIVINSDDINFEYQCLGYDENGNKYDDFTIICNKGSTAATYAESNGITAAFLDDSSDNEQPTQTSSVSKTNSTNNTAVTSSSDAVKKPAVKKALIKKITPNKKKLKVKWKKLKNVSGYQIKCGLNKKMTKGKKVVVIKTNRKSKIIKGLKSKKKYYVKVRAYKTYTSFSGKTLKTYGKWSKIKKAKTK